MFSLLMSFAACLSPAFSGRSFIVWVLCLVGSLGPSTSRLSRMWLAADLELELVLAAFRNGTTSRVHSPLFFLRFPCGSAGPQLSYLHFLPVARFPLWGVDTVHTLGSPQPWEFLVALRLRYWKNGNTEHSQRSQ